MNTWMDGYLDGWIDKEGRDGSIDGYNNLPFNLIYLVCAKMVAN